MHLGHLEVLVGQVVEVHQRLEDREGLEDEQLVHQEVQEDLAVPEAQVALEVELRALLVDQEDRVVLEVEPRELLEDLVDQEDQEDQVVLEVAQMIAWVGREDLEGEVVLN